MIANCLVCWVEYERKVKKQLFCCKRCKDRWYTIQFSGKGAKWSENWRKKQDPIELAKKMRERLDKLSKAWTKEQKSDYNREYRHRTKEKRIKKSNNKWIEKIVVKKQSLDHPWRAPLFKKVNYEY